MWKPLRIPLESFKPDDDAIRGNAKHSKAITHSDESFMPLHRVVILELQFLYKHHIKRRFEVNWIDRQFTMMTLPASNLAEAHEMAIELRNAVMVQAALKGERVNWRSDEIKRQVVQAMRIELDGIPIWTHEEFERHMEGKWVT